MRIKAGKPEMTLRSPDSRSPLMAGCGCGRVQPSQRLALHPPDPADSIPGSMKPTQTPQRKFLFHSRRSFFAQNFFPPIASFIIHSSRIKIEHFVYKESRKLRKEREKNLFNRKPKQRQEAGTDERIVEDFLA